MKKPLVSVIIPVFNRENLIGETLDSVISQTYANWECIVVDDGSHDNTEEVVNSYANMDNRITYFSRPNTRNKGASPSRNYGLEQATGDFIQFLDSDDLLHPNKLEEQLKHLESAPLLSVATCKWGSFRESTRLNVKQKYYSYKNYKNSLDLLYGFGKREEYFPPIVYLVPKKVIENAGYWDESIFRNPNDDGEYFSRIMLNASGIVFCENTTAYYRAGNESRLSLLDDEQKIRSVIESWKMIDSNLTGYPKLRRVYVGSGINSIYKRIKDSYPDIIKEYNEFFELRREPKVNCVENLPLRLKSITKFRNKK